MPFLIEFWSQNGTKMLPQILPKSSKSRSWGCFGPRDWPKMLQKSLRNPIWTIFDPFWTDPTTNLDDFQMILDWFLIEFGQFWDRIWSILRPCTDFAKTLQRPCTLHKHNKHQLGQLGKHQLGTHTKSLGHLGWRDSRSDYNLYF